MEDRIAFLLMIADDLREVRDFINASLADHPESADVRDCSPTQKALDLAVIITYGRVFKNNRGFRDVRPLLEAMLVEFTDEQRKLHDETIAARDQEYAHSDAEVNDITVYKGGLFQASRRVIRQPLSHAKLRLLHDMTILLLQRAEKEGADLIRQFRAAT